ncbi:hypothetical protein JVT61DRAFT_8113 [Boletus reticuloceps]|uniref:Uncharacterized protein n=1 Tax=Boletus reticuloceps TaxID=495285 RepID=A0A8I3AC88_9AGAM|nr:hypothetical protein JVT61DRAFT_8113 [Boletus reticuloceps]
MISQATLAYRLRIFFRVTRSNFVIPTIFSIIQPLTIFVGRWGRFLSDVIHVNGMLSVCGVVLASIWGGKEADGTWRQPVFECGRLKRTNDTGLGWEDERINSWGVFGHERDQPVGVIKATPGSNPHYIESGCEILYGTSKGLIVSVFLETECNMSFPYDT